jgi:site-specific recombinase XerD
MYGALKRAAQALDDEDDPEKYPWHEIDYATAVELPALLQDDDLAPASVNKILVAVRGALEAAWRSGQIDDDQYRKIEIKSVKGKGQSSGRALSPAEVAAFDLALEKTTPRDAAILTMMFACGMRRVEIVRSRIEDYDHETSTLTARGKGGKIRLVPVLEQYKHFLDRHWVLRDGGKLAFDDLTRRGVSWVVERFVTSSGIARFTSHDCRRSFATSLLQKGADIAIVARLLGHASIEVTKIYDRRGREAEIAAINLLRNPEKPDAT